MVKTASSMASLDTLSMEQSNNSGSRSRHISMQSTNGQQQPPQQADNICIEKIFCYLLKNYLYVVGSSNCKSKHRVLKFDRRYKNNLVISDNKRIMTSAELLEYRQQEGFDYSARVEPTVAFGIVGFIRFLEGYYIILIVKRRCVAMLGRHCIYKIEDTHMLYIPNEDGSNSEEKHYMRMFKYVDLASNFYFSYSYDLSNTLQYNLSPFYSCNVDQFQCGYGHIKTVWDMSESFLSSTKPEPFSDSYVFINPNMKFVWNEYLLSPMCNVHNDFFIYICHGFVSQAVMPISGRNLIITLIARRSKKYAGTRYLKRGANCEGYPANDVETEQIVHDGNVSSFRHGLYSSFVQLRGSVPSYWSQTIAKMGMPGKPPITIDLKDPFYEAAGKHFNNLLYDYGSPIIVLNLVKRKEKKPQESILFNEFEGAIEYLNQFLPKQHHIMLIGFDMARANKTKDQNVIALLSEIALYTLPKTGFFQNRNIAINKDSGWPKPAASHTISKNYEPIMQTGITRVNCVDCLDRTNTAQFAIGRVALAHQLFTMGVIAKPELPFDTDIVGLLEELYEDHGDTLALQYGGSQLVHRIKTYRKIAPITSQSKDIMQSLSRYYNNAFSDSDKQSAINLFLGIYQAHKNSPIWTQFGDYALHHTFALCKASSEHFKPIDSSQFGRTRYTKWWSDEVALCLPRAAREFFKDFRRLDPHYVKRFLTYDWFFDVHRLQECTILADTFLFNMKKSKSYMDRMSIKKLTNFRTQNRQSLVGIPLNTAKDLNEDSDPSDVSDSENDNIIIRFESDCHVVEYEECVQDGAEFDFAGANCESSASQVDPEMKTKQYLQNWLNVSNRDFTKPAYKKRMRAQYRNLTAPVNQGAGTSSYSMRVYNEYLHFEDKIADYTRHLMVQQSPSNSSSNSSNSSGNMAAQPNGTTSSDLSSLGSSISYLGQSVHSQTSNHSIKAPFEPMQQYRKYFMY